MEVARARSSVGSYYDYVFADYARPHLDRAALIEMYRRPRYTKLVYAYILQAIDTRSGESCASIFGERKHLLAPDAGSTREKSYEHHSESEMREGLKQIGLSHGRVKFAYGYLTVSLIRPALLHLYRARSGQPGIAYLVRVLDEREGVVDKADYALIVFAYASGCRVSEIATTSLSRTEPNHLDLAGGVLTITQAKYNSVGTVPLDVASMRVLRWYVRDVRPRFKNAQHLHHLFVSKVGRPYRPNVLTQKFSLLLSRFGFGNKTAHAFRHYYVTDLLRRGVQPHVVQALARHRDARTALQIYAHPTPDDLRAAVHRRLA
jgi:integrase